jgi:hypothetical protein
MADQCETAAFSQNFDKRHQIFAMEGVERHITFEIERFELNFQFVARGFGSAIVPQAMADGRQLPYLRIVPNREGDVIP